MATTTVYEVTCSECGAETSVGVTRWPATALDPADGETNPEECRCGNHFGGGDRWVEVEPDPVEPDGDDYDE